MAQLEGTYPIQVGGEITGTLTVAQEGLMTVFSADSRDDGELIRLSVFDETGKAGYLGVMVPENGRLSLVKRLSRVGLSTFPEKIVCAGVVWEAEQEDGQEERHGTETEPEETETAAEVEPEEAAAVVELSLEKEPKPEPEPYQQEEQNGLSHKEEAEFSPQSELEERKSDLIWKMQPNPWSLFSEPGMKAALCSVRGALTTTESGRVLLAIPTSMDGIALSERIVEAGEVRMIDGTQYVVFRL